MNQKRVWFDARDLKDEDIVLPFVYNLSYEYIIIKFRSLNDIKAPKKMKFVVEINSIEELFEVPKEYIILSQNIDVLAKASIDGYCTAFYQAVTNQEEMDTAWKVGKDHKFLVVQLMSETNIPLELLIAKLQNTGSDILKIVNSKLEAEIALGVMEVGSDGIVLKTEILEEIAGVDKLINDKRLEKLELVTAKVTKSEHIGMGYRVCIDTTTLMNTNEGMLIGSTSQGGILVSSETHFLPYMKLRPFRVNAGAVHSYIWTPNGETNYLTELESGSKVLCIDTEGNAREVSVGRVKIEVRPLLKIEAEANEQKINVIVQDDWHIRIFAADGSVRNASTIKEGDELLAYVCQGGRHVGIKIDEHIEEK